jgi:protein O-GlcNAc transferase
MVVNVGEPPYSKAEEDEFYRRVDIIDDLDPDAEATGTVQRTRGYNFGLSSSPTQSRWLMKLMKLNSSQLVQDRDRCGGIMNNVAQIFSDALAALNSRDLAKAENLFRRVVETDSSHVPALNLLVVALMSMERFEEAEPFIVRAIALDQKSDVSFYNFGVISKRLNKPQQALENFDKALNLNPDVAETWNSRGTIFNDLRRYDSAVADFDKAISLNALSAEAYANKGKSLTLLRRYDEAVAAYDKALSIKPDLESCWLGRGDIFTHGGRYDEALAAYDRALSIKPDLEAALFGRGNVFFDLKRHDEALAAYDKALWIKPDLELAWVGRGNVFLDLKRRDEALAAHNKALSIKPDSENAWLGRGNVFCDLKRYDEALAAYDEALSIKPDSENAWLGRGNVFCDLKRYDEAFAAYDKALSIKPDLEGVEGSRLFMKMQLCDWEELDKEISDLTNSVRAGKANCPPFALLSMNDLPDAHRRCAQAWVAAKHPITAKPLWQGKETYKHDKIRLGYVSADLRTHPIGHLVAELFELHDKKRFSVTAFSLGRDDNSLLRRRLVSSFDRFIDCHTLSDLDIARAIADSEIDILVDLMGFTRDYRLNIFAYRPAPIQVNYLGYPGTMGASYIDYIVGDKTLFTFADVAAYSERLVQLPDSYQPNDRKRQISTKAFARQEARLPDSKFVFCCFNNSYKILPRTFACWMRILQSVEWSVLWLLAENQTATANLKKEAQSRGIDPARLVFADRMQLPDHLARHSLADLFLDTLPYTAHTTASDALWAGLPVLTQKGSTFAGRVAASLLKAIDLPELIAHSPEEYETLAIELARNQEKLQSTREKLARNRLTTPLFDTPLYTKHLEAAYQAMYHRYQAGLPPDHIRVSRADGNQTRSADLIGVVPDGA